MYKSACLDCGAFDGKDIDACVRNAIREVRAGLRVAPRAPGHSCRNAARPWQMLQNLGRRKWPPRMMAVRAAHRQLSKVKRALRAGERAGAWQPLVQLRTGPSQTAPLDLFVEGARVSMVRCARAFPFAVACPTQLHPLPMACRYPVRLGCHWTSSSSSC